MTTRRVIDPDKHHGYHLLPQVVKGFRMKRLRCVVAASYSWAVHSASNAASSYVFRQPRYGLTLNVRGRTFAVYFENHGVLVSESHLAVGAGATPLEKGATESAQTLSSSSVISQEHPKG